MSPVEQFKTTDPRHLVPITGTLCTDGLDPVRRTIAQLVVYEPFFATLLINMKLVHSDIPCWISATELGVNMAWYRQLNAKQRRTLLVHEAMHRALLHDLRRGNRDGELWNEACDWAINGHLVGDSYEFPPDGCTDPVLLAKYAGQSAEQIYSQLVDTRDNEDESQDSSEKSQDNNDSGESESNAGSEDGTQPDSSDQNPSDAGKTGKAWDQIVPPDCIDESIKEKEMKRLQELETAKQSAKSIGSMPAFMNESLKELNKTPVADWSSIMARWVEERCPVDWSYTKPNAFFSPILMPSLHGEEFAEFKMALDTSSSMRRQELEACADQMLECMRVYEDNGQQVELECIYCTSVVTGTQRITSSNDLIVPQGRGGTEFDPVFRHIEKSGEQPVGLVYLTDGYGYVNVEQPQYDVLWVITEQGDKDFTPPFGEVIHLNA